MQQYFVNEEVILNKAILLDDDTLYHLIKVLRKDEKYTFRIVDNKQNVYHAHLIDKKTCLPYERLDENNELETDITCILSLIKNDKFELIIQKLVELGVKRIVPYEANRSVVKANPKRLERLNKIILEASEQSHRNIIPTLENFTKLKDLNKYKSELNYICYESEENIVNIPSNKSITYVIGPEGGFEDKEYEEFIKMGFKSISLGKRILRAETAAIYMTSVIVSKNQ